MGFDFDTLVDRTGIGNMKERFTPQPIRDAGLPSYWGAEFDFKTAPAIIEAVKKAADNGLFGYTLPSSEYLDRVVWWFETQRGFRISPDWILPTPGTVFSGATSQRAFTGPGEGMIMLTPGYARYRQAATRLGRKTVESALILRRGRHTIDFEDLESKMADRGNKLFVLCNPNNPTGTVWNRDELKRISGLADRYGVVVFSDEIFAEIVFDGNETVPYVHAAGDGSAGITCTSLGKSFGLTGVNHANVVIPDPALRERFLVQRNADHYGSVDPMLHAALLGAYTEEGASWLSAMREYVWQNYLLIDAFFRKHIPSVAVTKPEGTYVLWIDFSGLGLRDGDLTRFLLEEAFLCLDSGEDYGGPSGFMRMNISVPRHVLERSLGLLLDAVRARGFGA